MDVAAARPGLELCGPGPPVRAAPGPGCGEPPRRRRLWKVGGVDNRDLYLAVADLVARNADNGRSLEEFLRTLRAALEPHYAEPGLPPERFVAALDAAFTGPASRNGTPAGGGRTCRAATTRRRMRQRSTASSSVRCSTWRTPTRAGRCGTSMRGVRDARSVAPTGHGPRDRGLLLQLGPAGLRRVRDRGRVRRVGTRRPDTGRMLVPGDVAVLTDEGIASVPADEIESPVVELLAPHLGAGRRVPLVRSELRVGPWRS